MSAPVKWCKSWIANTKADEVRNNGAMNTTSTFCCGKDWSSPRPQTVSAHSHSAKWRARARSIVWKPRFSASCGRTRRAENRARISHFLASYFSAPFLELSTIVHTAFQRVYQTASRCYAMLLARSPHCSTCAIHMNDNNLRNGALLRADFTRSTLRSPHSNRTAAIHSRDQRRNQFSCSFCPATARLDRWNPRRETPGA